VTDSQPSAGARAGKIHDVHVWTASVSNMTDTAFAFLASACSVAEIQRSRAFVFERDRRSYLVAHGLLRHALSQYDSSRARSDWSFRVGRHGRPEVAGAPPGGVRFNLSHCATRVACVVCAEIDCGVDVEATPREADSAVLIRRCLSAGERAWLASASPALRGERLLQLWTLKEAVAKAVGLGLTLPFAALDLDLRGTLRVRSAPPEATGPWWLSQRRSADGHFDAVALRVPDHDVVAIVYEDWVG